MIRTCKFIARHWFIILALLGLAYRLEYLREFSGSILFNSHVGPDISEYHMRALEILSGCVFPKSPNIHAPLYSFFLASVYLVFGCRVWIARFVQIFIAFVATLSISGLFCKLDRRPAHQVVFTTLMLFYPIPLYYQGELYAESIIPPFIAGLLWCLYLRHRIKSSWLDVLAGLCAGLCAITHGMLLSLIVGISLYLIATRQMKRTACFTMASLVLIISLCVAKSLHYGRPVFIQDNGGFNYYLGNNPASTGSCYLRPGLQWRKFHREMSKAASDANLSENSFLFRTALKYQISHPVDALTLLWKKASLVWSGRELISSADADNIVGYTDIVRGGKFITPVLVFFAAVGICTLRRKNRIRFTYFWLVGGSVFIAQIVLLTCARYRQPMMWPMILLTTLGICYWDWRHFWPVPVIIAVVMGIAYYPIHYSTHYEGRAIYGEAAYEQGKYDMARSMLIAARRKVANPATVDNLLGNIAAREGNTALARQCYNSVIQDDTDRSLAYMNLAMLPDNSVSESDSLYAMAISSAPQNALAHYNYSRFLLMCRGDVTRARFHINAAIGMDRTNPEFWNLSGIIAMREGDNSAARRFMQRAYSLDPSEKYFNNIRYIERLSK